MSESPAPNAAQLRTASEHASPVQSWELKPGEYSDEGQGPMWRAANGFALWATFEDGARWLIGRYGALLREELSTPTDSAPTAKPLRLSETMIDGLGTLHRRWMPATNTVQALRRRGLVDPDGFDLTAQGVAVLSSQPGYGHLAQLAAPESSSREIGTHTRVDDSADDGPITLQVDNTPLYRCADDGSASGAGSETDPYFDQSPTDPCSCVGHWVGCDSDRCKYAAPAPADIHASEPFTATCGFCGRDDHPASHIVSQWVDGTFTLWYIGRCCLSPGAVSEYADLTLIDRSEPPFIAQTYGRDGVWQGLHYGSSSAWIGLPFTPENRSLMLSCGVTEIGTVVRWSTSEPVSIVSLTEPFSASTYALAWTLDRMRNTAQRLVLEGESASYIADYLIGFYRRGREFLISDLDAESAFQWVARQPAPVGLCARLSAASDSEILALSETLDIRAIDSRAARLALISRAVGIARNRALDHKIACADSVLETSTFSTDLPPSSSPKQS